MAFKMSRKSNHSDVAQKLQEITDVIKKNIQINKPYKV